jgi:hypothetical protein
MAQYGEILDVYEPEKDMLYKSMTTFFNNPMMTKIKDVNQYSMYMSKTYCLLNRNCRYLIAFVNKDELNVGSTSELRTLRWDSFQTRTMSENHKLQSHAYKAQRGGHLDVPINRVNVDEEASTYDCDKLSLTVTLLHTKKGPSEYNDNGTLIAALETYQTVLSFK